MYVRCGCENELELGADLLGRPVTCPKCKSPVRPVAAGGGADVFTCVLTIIAGPENRKGEQFALGGDGDIGIGKIDTNPIRLITPKVSRNHAILRRTHDGGWRIDDNKSTNGVFANGQRVVTHELHDGDVLRVGEYVLRFTNPLEAEQVETLEEVTAAPAVAEEAAAFGDAQVAKPAAVPAAVTQAPAAPTEADDDVAELTADDEVPVPMGAHVADNAIPVTTEEELYDFVEPDDAPPPAPRPRPAPAAGIPAAPMSFGTAAGVTRCMGCGQNLPFGAKICVTCGIDLATGRPLVTSKDIEDDVAIRADTWIKIISVFLPLGLFPIASEAFGTKKPHATWVAFALTLVASIAFFAYVKAHEDDASPRVLNLMHWTGSRAVTDKETADLVQTFARMARDSVKRESKDGTVSAEDERAIQKEAKSMAARYAGAPDGVGFHWYQLLTHALLHGGILHVAGNMLFLLVFGLRVNELVGSLKFAVIYPLLAAASAAIDGWMHAGQPLQGSLGASGAIMGLAGMYLIFFPVQRVHMAFWIRLRLWLTYKLFTMRGLWLLAMWIALNDLLPMLFGAEDHVAHWAHLGGFTVGVVLAVALLATRQVNAHGADLISMLLGRRAWPIVGRPGAARVTPSANGVPA